jgi:hypothetical protein
MKTVSFTLVGIAPLGFSRPIQSVKETGEADAAFEQRIWREKMHVDGKGQVIIPPQNLKNCLVEIAQYLSESVRGKGKATWTKHFEAGVMVTEPMPLRNDKNEPIMADDVEPVRVFVPSDGRRGGGKRVHKMFPVIKEGWRCSGQAHLLDPRLQTETERVEQYLVHAGQFIGLGWFRPRRNGYYGRFRVEGFKEV